MKGSSSNAKAGVNPPWQDKINGTVLLAHGIQFFQIG
jgi:hypothetical protein